jgi:hypothetical protein
VLGVFYVALPFHDVVRRKYDREVAAALLTSLKSESTKSSLTLWVLVGFLVVLAIASLAMTAHLLDNLKFGPYSNLFTQLVYLRGILYFGLGIECLLWYRGALTTQSD